MSRPQEPIYLSGPMSGYEDFNRGAFESACKALRGKGFRVLSPHEVGEEPGKSWADYIRKDMIMLMEARTVVVLPGWECSRGSVLEVHIAQQLAVPVLPLSVALRAAPEEPSDPTDKRSTRA